MTEPAAHAEQWRDYHARWIWFLGAWAVGFMVFSGLLMISPALPGDAGCGSPPPQGCCGC